MLRTRASVRFSSTSIFPKLSDVKPEQLLGKEFGGKAHTYHVSRTSLGHLPVYKDVKSKAIYTEIRKIQGDIVQLRNDLQNALPHIEKNDFKCVMQSLKIIIKGDHKLRITQLLGKKF